MDFQKITKKSFRKWVFTVNYWSIAFELLEFLIAASFNHYFISISTSYQRALIKYILWMNSLDSVIANFSNNSIVINRSHNFTDYEWNVPLCFLSYLVIVFEYIWRICYESEVQASDLQQSLSDLVSNRQREYTVLLFVHYFLKEILDSQVSSKSTRHFFKINCW